MHDIKWIRENPAAFDTGLARRGLAPLSQGLLTLDAEKRGLQTRAQELQARKNALAKEAGMAKSKGQDASALFEEAKQVGEQLKAAEEAMAGEDMLTQQLVAIPNMLDDSVPDGADESANEEIKTEGMKPELAFAPKDHVDLGEALGLMDFEAAAKMSGARFVVLKGGLARLERALGQFMLNQQTEEYGYIEVAPPVMVRDEALFGTGQLPKFADDLFKTLDGRWLIPTAEVSITNIVADTILDAAKLPLRMTACTPCFRAEAGSAGRDTRGMIRQHQFTKVELVSITTPQQSAEEHERMLGAAENILKKLGLHYRVVLLCSGDTGFGAQKTYDIEVWLPGQGAYREISSCSNFGAFQARRLKTRYRNVGEKGTQFVHTLNGSGLAVGRTLVAVLENYQEADGSIRVPEVLVPYMGGLTKISSDAKSAVG